MPDKTIASLVKYYYSWKKTRSRTSVMDRQEKMKAKEGSENGSENGSNDDSDSEDKVCSVLEFSFSILIINNMLCINVEYFFFVILTVVVVVIVAIFTGFKLREKNIVLECLRI